eukprot:g8089.t1
MAGTTPNNASITKVLRTPESCFDVELPGWTWGKPSYFVSKLFNVEIRIAYWDLGSKSSGETMLLCHGEPSWSYLYRRMIDPLIEQGYRVVLFDQVGFGWSDKPSKPSDYTYERHVAWNEDLIFNHLDLRNITIFLQDWGGIQGLRMVARSPSKFYRLVISNTVFPTCNVGFEGENYISDGFYNWKKMVNAGLLSKSGAVGRLMGRATAGPNGVISEAEQAAYQAPFPDETYMAGAIQYPELVPTPPKDPTGRPQPNGGQTNLELWPVLENWHKPVLLAFGDNDIVLGGSAYLFEQKCPGVKKSIILKGVGHFSQDSGGKELVKEMIELVEMYPLLPATGMSKL